MSTATARNYWKPALLVAAVAFVYAGVLARLGRFWWDDPNYSHGLLIPFVIGYILWSERERLSNARKQPSLALGGLMVVCGVLALWAGVAGAELFVQRTSLVLVVAGVVTYLYGPRLLSLLSVPLLLLLLAIPIPTIVFNKVAFPLQLFASRCAVWAMRLFDIPVLRSGNIIELRPLNAATTKKLEVVEACSGIRSLMTLLTLAVVYAYFTSPKTDAPSDGGSPRARFAPGWPLWRALIIVLSAVPIAIITNAARVSGTGVLAHYYGTEVADGFFHSFSGWVVYVTAFILLFAVGSLIDRLASVKRGGGKGQQRRDAEANGSAAAHEPLATDSSVAEPTPVGNAPS